MAKKHFSDIVKSKPVKSVSSAAIYLVLVGAIWWPLVVTADNYIWWKFLIGMTALIISTVPLVYLIRCEPKKSTKKKLYCISIIVYLFLTPFSFWVRCWNIKNGQTPKIEELNTESEIKIPSEYEKICLKQNDLSKISKIKSEFNVITREWKFNKNKTDLSPQVQMVDPTWVKFNKWQQSLEGRGPKKYFQLFENSKKIEDNIKGFYVTRVRTENYNPCCEGPGLDGVAGCPRNLARLYCDYNEVFKYMTNEILKDK